MDSKLSNIGNFEHKSIIEQVNGQKLYKIQFDIGDFRAENIKIRLQDSYLIVNGYQEQDGDPVKKTKRFEREIPLPEFVLVDKMHSYLIPDKTSSILNIEAPIDADCYAKIKKLNNTSLDIDHDIISATPNNQVQVRKSNLKKPCLPTNDISESNCGILKYKFNLKEFRPQDISMCVKDGNKLIINALNEVYDYYGKMIREFIREINLPTDVDPYKIRNIYDAGLGLLLIEIPLHIKRRTNLNDFNDFSSNKNFETEKLIGESYNVQDSVYQETFDNYLELVFDLTGFELKDIKIVPNDEQTKILKITATKNSEINSNEYERQYNLPGWVSTSNFKVLKKTIEANRNIIIIKLPIRKL